MIHDVVRRRLISPLLLYDDVGHTAMAWRHRMCDMIIIVVSLTVTKWRT